MFSTTSHNSDTPPQALQWGAPQPASAGPARHQPPLAWAPSWHASQNHANGNGHLPGPDTTSGFLQKAVTLSSDCARFINSAEHYHMPGNALSTGEATREAAKARKECSSPIPPTWGSQPTAPSSLPSRRSLWTAGIRVDQQAPPPRARRLKGPSARAQAPVGAGCHVTRSQPMNVKGKLPARLRFFLGSQGAGAQEGVPGPCVCV